MKELYLSKTLTLYNNSMYNLLPKVWIFANILKVPNQKFQVHIKQDKIKRLVYNFN